MTENSKKKPPIPLDPMKRSFQKREDIQEAVSAMSPSIVSEATHEEDEDNDISFNVSSISEPTLKKRASPIPMERSSSSKMDSSEGSLRSISSIRRPQRLASSGSISAHRISFCDDTVARSFSNDDDDLVQEDLADEASCASDALLESSNWKVMPSSITQVPLIYPLSASSGFVENCSSLKVSARISHCLTTRSVAAMYDDDRGTAMATTDDGVGFAIRLFHGSGSYSTGIIVEVQHQAGDPLTFHRTCQMLFEAAKGQPYSRSSKNATQQVRAPPATLLKGRHFDDYRDQINMSLERANELLEKDRIDAKKLGMEMLIFLTNPVQEATAQQDEHTLYAAETIVLGRDAIGMSLHEKLFNLLHKSQKMQDTKKSDDSDEEDEYEDHEEISLLRPLALKVVRNCLGVLSKSTDIREVVEDNTVPEWLVDSLVPALVKEVQTAHVYPGDAYIAAECLIALFELSDKAKLKAADLNAIMFLESAHLYGVKYHALLGRATQVGVTELKTFMARKTEHD